MAAKFGLFFGTSVQKINILQRFAYCTRTTAGGKFDKGLLDILICPLSKESLRYDEQTNELINDKLNVAYPIHNGTPNLNPVNARKKDAQTK